MKSIRIAILLVMCLCFFGKKIIAQTPDLIISEIMYNPPEDGADSLEFIEIYNNENSSVNLAGIGFGQGITHTFPNIEIDPQEYLVLAKDSIAFFSVFGLSAYEWESGTLSNNGEIIEIIDPNGNSIDIVEYQTTSPTNGLGASLVLCDISSNNNIFTNWDNASTATGNIINGKEMIANPFADSACPTGPIIKFQKSIISILEEEIFLEIPLILENGNSNLTTVTIQLDSSSDAVFNEDFTMTTIIPFDINFATGVEKDTQIVVIEIFEDSTIEPNETIELSLINPTNNAIINPMYQTFKIIIEDDDATLPNLMISEIMYNPPETGSDSTEFIEIFNNDTLDVNLVSYYFSEGINFTFPEIILESGKYIVIARDSVAFANYYGFTPIEWTSGSLTNSGEVLELRNAGGSVADVVEYSNTVAWSEKANGMGASLVLCNVNENNNDPTNWDASISETGLVIEGFEIMADPMDENNCFIPLSPFPNRTIGEMTSTNNDGEVDSLNRKCALQGIVHGVNLNTSNNGLQFVLIDGNEDGITVYNNSNSFGYSVIEGDEVKVHGTISQFNGLIEIIADTLFVISNNNTLTNANIVTQLNESTESQLVEIKNLSLLNPDDWDNSTPDGFNVEVTDGINIYLMRIDQDVDLYEMPNPDYSFNLTGLGSQNDSEFPFLDDYLILPRYFEDLEMITSNLELEKRNHIQIYPNPASDFLNIRTEWKMDKILIENILGLPITNINQPNEIEKINCKNWNSGIYIISVFSKNQKWTFKFLK